MRSVENREQRIKGDVFKPVVLAPTYNNSRTLRGILERVAALGLPMIVVNDGMTDATAEVLAEWRRELSLKLLRLKHLIPSRCCIFGSSATFCSAPNESIIGLNRQSRRSRT
ncbi:MAG TPA: glycosyltransferase [Tepidisphaeraceae bacterium]|jgi:glycosyltransferase involved in cell wall biosynthesis|nr:glycosyltransferase [Tepidisphaeraceae bacterium]